MDFSSLRVLYRVLTIEEEIALELTTEGPHEMIYALGMFTVLDKNGHYSVVMDRKELLEFLKNKPKLKLLQKGD